MSLLSNSPQVGGRFGFEFLSNRGGRFREKGCAGLRVNRSDIGLFFVKGAALTFYTVYSPGNSVSIPRTDFFTFIRDLIRSRARAGVCRIPVGMKPAGDGAIDHAFRLQRRERRAVGLTGLLRARDIVDHLPVAGVPDGHGEIAGLVALENDPGFGDSLPFQVVHQRGGRVGGGDEIMASLGRQRTFRVGKERAVGSDFQGYRATGLDGKRGQQKGDK